MKGPSITEIPEFTQQHLNDDECFEVENSAKAAVFIVENLDTSKQIDGVDLETIIRSILLSKSGHFNVDNYIRILTNMDTPIGVLDCVYHLQLLDGETEREQITRIVNSENCNLIIAKIGILKNRLDTTTNNEVTAGYLKELLHSPPVADILVKASMLSPHDERIKV